MPKRITREELYQLVWKTPMSRLARDFGVTDVALAKTCKRWNIPRPGRGYWARLGAGMEVEPAPPLPLLCSEGARESIQMEPAGPPAAKPARPVAPAVTVSSSLRRAHGAVRGLGAALAVAARDEHGRLVVDGGEHPTFAVTVSAHRRALAILDGVAKVLSARGHDVLFRRDGERGRFLAMVAGEEIPVAIVERLDQKPHESTDDEKAQAHRGYRATVRKYDYFAGGRLQLLVGTSRRSWSDSGTRRLEESLGSAVIGVEDELEAIHARQRAAEELRQRAAAEQSAREEEQRQRREREARARRQTDLMDDLKRKAQSWSLARQLREFIAEAENVIPVGVRTDQMTRWFEWAHESIRALDPLSAPAAIHRSIDVE